MIKILNQSLELQAILANVLSPLITEEINREFTLNFGTIIDGDKSHYINYQHIAEVDNNYFDIADTKEIRNADDTLIIDVECDHVSYRLSNEDNIIDGFVSVGTCTELMNTLLNGTDFTVGTVDFTESKTIAINEKTTRRAVLLAIAAEYGGELKFDKFEISVLTRRGADRGVQFRYRKNNISAFRKVDNRKRIDGQPTISYGVSAVELEFAEGYDEDEHYELGDDVDIIDEGLNLNINARIVKHSYNPDERMQGDVTIANFIEDLSDTITNIQQRTVIKGNLYNGCRITPENGFEATRSDNKVKTVQNATEGISVKKGDGTGESWANAFYVDTDGNIRLKDAFIELVTGVITMLLNPAVGIKISDSNGDLFSLDTATGQLNMNGNLSIKQAGKILMQVFKDTNGGVIRVFDNNGYLNAKIGIESGQSSNTGGTLILYKDVPEGDNPINYQRAEIGIVNDSGVMNLRDINTKARISISSNGSYPYIGIRDSNEDLKSYISESEGYINWQKIATELFVNQSISNIYTYVDEAISQAINAHIATLHQGG